MNARDKWLDRALTWCVVASVIGAIACVFYALLVRR